MNALRDFVAIIFSAILAVFLFVGSWKGSVYLAATYFPKEPMAVIYLFMGAWAIMIALAAAIKINARK